MSIGAGRRQKPNREVEASGKRTVWLNQCLTTRAPYKGWGEGLKSIDRLRTPSPPPSPQGGEGAHRTRGTVAAKMRAKNKRQRDQFSVKLTTRCSIARRARAAAWSRP